ncbi:MAG: hypothetical protein RL757_2710 [Bacteroidota bacterium]|jgi:hypothetical protein
MKKVLFSTVLLVGFAAITNAQNTSKPGITAKDYLKSKAILEVRMDINLIQERNKFVINSPNDLVVSRVAGKKGTPDILIVKTKEGRLYSVGVPIGSTGPISTFDLSADEQAGCNKVNPNSMLNYDDCISAETRDNDDIANH